MRLLIRPEPYPDESLESYLLRLSQENGFERYALLSGAIRDSLLVQDHEASGAFPLELARVNVFHAQRSSGLRVRALQLFAQLTDLDPARLLQLALMHSGLHFGSGHACVHRAGVDIPLGFIRTGPIPVCPACLRESAYIRQHWHYSPYLACHQHGCQLLHLCPSCGEALDYQRSESFTHCRCGFDLRTAITQPAGAAAQQLSTLICGARFESTNPLLSSEHPSLMFGALYWYWLRNKTADAGKPECSTLTTAIDYFSAWPANFHHELQQMAQKALQTQTRLLNHTAFREVFGSLLTNCRQLPTRDSHRNFILHGLLDYLTELVCANPKTRVANLADIQLSAIEAAALLGTSVEQVFRLLQDGYLTPAHRRIHGGLKPHEPLFHLRHVIECRQAHRSTFNDTYHTYLPAW
jgi:hypothetical protein